MILRGDELTKIFTKNKLKTGTIIFYKNKEKNTFITKEEAYTTILAEKKKPVRERSVYIMKHAFTSFKPQNSNEIIMTLHTSHARTKLSENFYINNFKNNSDSPIKFTNSAWLVDEGTLDKYSEISSNILTIPGSILKKCGTEKEAHEEMVSAYVNSLNKSITLDKGLRLCEVDFNKINHFESVKQQFKIKNKDDLGLYYIGVKKDKLFYIKEGKYIKELDEILDKKKMETWVDILTNKFD